MSIVEKNDKKSLLAKSIGWSHRQFGESGR